VSLHFKLTTVKLHVLACLCCRADTTAFDVLDGVDGSPTVNVDGRQPNTDRGISVDDSSGSDTESYVVDSDVEPDDVTDALPVTVSTYVLRNTVAHIITFVPASSVLSENTKHFGD